MTATVNSTKEQELSFYLQICADAYGEALAKNNQLDSSWRKVNLVIDEGVVSEEYYYGFDERNGFDAAIYYNGKDVIVGIRGTETTANDGDVLESL